MKDTLTCPLMRIFAGIQTIPLCLSAWVTVQALCVILLPGYLAFPDPSVPVTGLRISLALLNACSGGLLLLSLTVWRSPRGPALPPVQEL